MKLEDNQNASISTGAPLVLQEQSNCWTTAKADQASIIIDADAYFQHARNIMLKAEKQLLLIGWDFDARIFLGDNSEDGAPNRLGPFLSWLAEKRPELQIYILRWDVGAVKTLFRGTTIFSLIKWMSHPNITTKLDSFHPFGSSHHQKIVVADDSFAFCGGIDMTIDRWDTREHMDDNPARIEPSGKAYGPWHDATMALQGQVAQKLGDLCRMRWEQAGGKPIAPPKTNMTHWPDNLPVDFTNQSWAIARSLPEMPERPAVHESEQLFLDLIRSAKHYLYIENQYFASRKVALAIADRLQQEDCPEIVIVMPQTANGWLEPIAMDTARAHLLEALRKIDGHHKLAIYWPCTAKGEAIYVHAKILIMDDHILRVGSSNLNNRSMRLDTECDVLLDTEVAGNSDNNHRIRAIRDDLLCEHLGCDDAVLQAKLKETGSLISTINALCQPDGRRLCIYEVEDLSEVEKFLAENKILDPEGPQEMFEPLTKRSLTSGIKARALRIRDRLHIPYRRRQAS